MLQQTQVTAVLTHFDNFLSRFPSMESLASSTEDEVLHAWHGLGYYRRALRLREAAKIVISRFNGELPKTAEELCSLPGIGKSTAGAILSCAYGIAAPILDGNVRRVLSRFHAVNGPDDTKVTESKLWQLAEKHTPSTHAAEYTQAIMDLGALVCRRTNPLCSTCPVQAECRAFELDAIDQYPRSTTKVSYVSEHKRPFVILDSQGSCLLQQCNDSGIYARLWENPNLPANTTPQESLRQLNLPVHDVVIHSELSLPKYTISNKKITEHVTVAQYSLQESNIGTPKNMRWYTTDEEDRAGMSVKTVERINLARSFGTYS